jgi:hypothetical protein
MSSDEPSDGGRDWTGGDLARRVRRRRRALGLSPKKSPDGRRWIPIDRVEHAPAALIVGALIRLADALDTNVSDLLGAHPARPPGHGRAALHPVLDVVRETECRQLIKSGRVGRVAFELAGRLSVLPVNFAMHDGVVVFRTAATTAIGHYGAGPVSFEADRIDEGLHEGWSVLISATARQAKDEELTALALSVEPWAGGDRGVYVVIEPEQVNGRRIRTW